MEEVDKGYSKFCVTFVTATRTAGILIHSRLKVLAVNLSWPSGRFFLYAGFIGSNNPCWLKADLVVCANPSSSFSWGWVGFFWYRLTWVVPDKGLLYSCVCVCPFVQGRVCSIRLCPRVTYCLLFAAGLMSGLCTWLGHIWQWWCQLSQSTEDFAHFHCRSSFTARNSAPHAEKLSYLLPSELICLNLS